MSSGWFVRGNGGEAVVQEALAIGHLDREAGAGIDFDDHGSEVGIEEDIDAHVAEGHGLVAESGGFEALLKALDGVACEGFVGIGVILDRAVFPDAAQGFSCLEIDADADCTAVEVGFAVGLLSGDAGHGHDGCAIGDDDSEVGCARGFGHDPGVIG
ncbi:MAG: hypothetical protein RI897_2172 [Verrucomicrobiota bacterium]